LTALKNLVTALNSATQNYLNINGALSSAAITAPTVIKATTGRLVEVAIIAAGTTVGTIYDGATLTATTKPLSPLPNAVGVFRVNFPASTGLLVVPGVGQTVTVSYS
jgi:hypothetical protein